MIKLDIMTEKINLTNQSPFEQIKHTAKGEEFWYARELMPALGYESWDGFHPVIKRAKASMSKVYPQVEDHFRQVSHMIRVAAGTKKEAMRSSVDYKLTRYACYLIAQNGDPTRKKEVAEAQTYFAIQTRKQELEEEKEKAIERVIARRKLRETEKKFSGVLSSKGLSGNDIAEIRSAGDEALFNLPTREIKERLGIKSGSLADRLPTITIKAKDLATEITTFNTNAKNLSQKHHIKREHQDNNYSVRKLLNEKNIYPEKLAPEIDISKIEKRISEEELLKKKTNDFIGVEDLIIDIINVEDEQELKRIRLLLDNNQGTTDLKIVYGSKENPKMIIRKVSITTALINGLRKYLIIV